MKKTLCISVLFLLLNTEVGGYNAPRKHLTKIVRNEPQETKDERFKYRMAMLESNNDHTVVNRFGYMGKYQFGMSTLRLLAKRGYMEPVTKTEFLRDVMLQEKAMDALIKENRNYIYRNKLNLYIGKKVRNTKITLEGMLAASHLVGPYAVKQFLYTDGRVNKKDGNGTSVVDYLSKFENEENISD